MFLDISRTDGETGLADWLPLKDDAQELPRAGDSSTLDRCLGRVDIGGLVLACPSGALLHQAIWCRKAREYLEEMACLP